MLILFLTTLLILLYILSALIALIDINGETIEPDINVTDNCRKAPNFSYGDIRHKFSCII